ncbi:DNA topoisomerase 3-alpha isoform X8 [Folsomia candida]|uniref:DNA topoisomerase 3-alpha isoform X8 n=1 Tax=Folsomia candida TaxID=158441 RepID=UPI000B8FED39|nr:DNA topoisomerase 3-alpha isoform X8 [Folsomia candida]
MLLKYLVPVAGLVVLQVFLNSNTATAQVDLATTGGDLSGEKDDLDSAELFLRPVVIKYGHDHPGIYTWQGGSGVGQGWGVYQQKAQVVMMKPAQGGSGWGEKKMKKKKSKKKKKKKKKKKEKKGGWGWAWIEEGGDSGGGQVGAGGYGGGGGGDDDESSEEKKSRSDLPPKPELSPNGQFPNNPNIQPVGPGQRSFNSRWGRPDTSMTPYDEEDDDGEAYVEDYQPAQFYNSYY